MALNKTDKSFKTLINKRFTTDGDTTGRPWFSEEGAPTLNIHSSDVWTGVISTTASVSVAAGSASFYDHFPLTPDGTFPSNSFFFMSGAGFFPGTSSYTRSYQVTDFISDKFGVDYEIQLYTNDNNQVFKTDIINWIFDYKTGILHVADPANGSSYQRPWKVSVYKYVGQTLAQGGATGGSGTSGTSGVSGTSGTAGSSGTTGLSGTSGTTGTSGTSGSSGIAINLMSVAGSNTVYDLPTGSYDGLFTKYIVKSGSNARSGYIMSTWSDLQLEFTEVTTKDLGNTSAVTMSIVITSSVEVKLEFFTPTGGWKIKTLTDFV